MLKPFYNEEAVAVGDETYRLVLNFRAIDATETLLGYAFPKALSLLSRDDTPLNVAGKFLWGLMREHHPEVTLDQAAGLMFGETGLLVGLAVRRLLDASFPSADDEGKATDKNPL